MTETEYVNATNLAKLRMTEEVLRHVYPASPVTQDDLRRIHVALARVRRKLERRVKLEEPT